MQKYAIIVNSVNGYEQLSKEYSEVDFFASDYVTYDYLKNNRVNYLYGDSSSNEDQLKEIYLASLNWFRDNEGNCTISDGEITVGPVIARSVISSFANDYRNYIAFKCLLKKYDKLYLSKASLPSFIRVSKVFDGNVFFHNILDISDATCGSSPVRTVISDKNLVHPLSKIMRQLQLPIKKYLQNKNLVWKDWSYTDQFRRRNDSLQLNYLNPLKAFYLINNHKYISEAKRIFPDDLLCNVDIDLVNKRINRLNIEWDYKLITLFMNTILRIYSESIKALRNTYTIYKEFMLYYKPSLMVFPGEAHFGYLIGSQIAKNLAVKTLVVLDGYPAVKDDSSFFSLRKPGQLPFDKYVTFGQANYDLYKYVEGVPEDNLIMAKSPLVDKLRIRSAKKNSYVLLLAYTPKQHNPQARWDKRIVFVHDVVKRLVDIGEKKILLKIKEGSGENHEREYYASYLERKGLSAYVEVVSGEFNVYVLKAKYVIGQLSTSLFESICAYKPYYVYEPYESGLPDSYAKSSKLVPYQQIYRKLDQLIDAINKNRCVKVTDFPYIADGKNLSEINLTG